MYFTQIRIILESVFRAANRIGLLHDKCIENGKVNLTESSLFLSGQPTKYSWVRCKKPHFTKIISDAVKSIIFITGAASHTVDPQIENNINLTEYRKTLNTPYLLYSLTFQLLDVLIWFKKYADDNPDKEKNLSLWESTYGDWIEGKITRIAENGYGTFQPSSGGNTLSIIPPMIKDYNLFVGQVIQVIAQPDSSGKKMLIKDIKV